VSGPKESLGSGSQNLTEKLPVAATRLPVDRIDVWIVSLLETDNSPETITAVINCLSADEQVRAARFAFDRDRRRFGLGRGAVRNILASYLDCTPAEIAFAYGEFGKPRLDGKHAAVGLQFNASGSGDVAVCAVTNGPSVGIDIEQLREACDPDVVRYALSDVERTEFERISAEEQPTAFYRAWTRKEAYLKAVGCGLSRPLASFAVNVMPGDPPCLIRDDHSAAELASWSFADFDPAPGWVGTLVSEGPRRPVRRLVWKG
jgi:4'-phosphopantetheinyl transferase